MKVVRKSLFLFLALLVLGACKNAPEKSNTQKIAVSILPLKYFVERIGGKDYEVNVLVPPGSGPETWEPSPKDMAALSSATLFYFTGYLEFEVLLAGKLSASGPKPVNLSGGVTLIQSEESAAEAHAGHAHFSGVDPHYWVSPLEARVIAGHIQQSLSVLNPAKNEFYAANYQAFMKELDSLDRYIHMKLDPKKMRSFIIYHPSLAYYARDYNLIQLSLESEGKQPSTMHMKELVDLSKKNEIKQIFVQKQFDRQITASLSKEIGAELITLDHLSPDWLNNMFLMTDQIANSLHE